MNAYDAAMLKHARQVQSHTSCGTIAEPLPARYFRITFPERGRAVLKIGPGDHTIQQWELTQDDIKGLVRDCIPELLR